MTGRLLFLGIFVLVGSFFMTYWLMLFWKPRSSIASFASSEISDDAGLARAAITAGLRPSSSLKGWIEEVSRLNEKEVKIRGWSTDIRGEDTPITVIAFAEGKNALQTRTRGPRVDVADYLKLPNAAGWDMAFEGSVTCRPGRPLFVVAVTNDSYVELNGESNLLCPG